MRIAFVIDKEGWVQEYRAKFLKKQLPFDITILSSKNKNNFNKFDKVYYFSLPLILKQNRSHPYSLASITSHKIFEETNFADMIKWCKRCSVNSRILFDQFVDKVGYEPYYIPNGVDTSFFSFNSTKKQNDAIGWVGNVDRAAKNFEIIKKLRKHFNIRMVATKKKGGHKLPLNEMKEFYHSLDYFLVVSSSEGTPNPALEAASCGVPIISTIVGNMPDIISKETGFFIESGDIFNNAFKSIETAVSVDVEIHWTMKENIRRKMVSEWDWKCIIPKYMEFFVDKI